MKIKLVSACLLFLVLGLGALEIPGFTHQIMDNGLEVIMLENHNVPLTTVRITFRCGAIGQTAKTAGLFHLYEHMLFKGNRTYRTQRAFKSAMNMLGVGSWNGGTSWEYVTYYFTIPSEKTEEGISFWCEAVRYPLFNVDELENEKQVVINEIRGYHNTPARYIQQAIQGRLFYEYPWRRDVSGPVDIVESCTVEDLRDIQKKFYTPDNCALFIAGDIDPEYVIETVKSLFEDWERNPNPFRIENPHPPLEESSEIFVQNPSCHPGFVNIQMIFRGPEVGVDPESTYAADMLNSLLQDPNSLFKKNIIALVPEIYSSDYIWNRCYPKRDGGIISIGAVIRLQEGVEPYETAQKLERAIRDETKKMIKKRRYFSWKEFYAVKKIMDNGESLLTEKPAVFIKQASIFWATASTEYALDFMDNIKEVKHRQIASYLKRYIDDKNSLLVVEMSPQDYPKYSPPQEYEEITTDRAYWWQEREGALNED
jgi:zinc protease